MPLPTVPCEDSVVNYSSRSQSQNHMEEMSWYISLAFEKGVVAMRDQQKNAEHSIVQLRQHLETMDQSLGRLENRLVILFSQQQRWLEQNVKPSCTSESQGNKMIKDVESKPDLQHQLDDLISLARKSIMDKELQCEFQQKLDNQTTILDEILNGCSKGLLQLPPRLSEARKDASELAESKSEQVIEEKLPGTEADQADLQQSSPTNTTTHEMSRYTVLKSGKSANFSGVPPEPESPGVALRLKSDSFNEDAKMAVNRRNPSETPTSRQISKAISAQESDQAARRPSHTSSSGSHAGVFDFHLRTMVKLHEGRPSHDSIGTHTCLSFLRQFGIYPDIKAQRSGEEVQRSFAYKLLHGPFFTIICSGMIIAYSVLAGVEANLGMQAALDGDEIPSWMQIAMHVFNGWFALEVVLRLLVDGLEFFIGKDGRWNVFDLFLVTLSMLFLIIDGLSIGFFRFLRMFKVLRALKVVRVFRLFNELRFLVATILTSLASLWWSLAFVLVITYLCSILFVQGAITHIQSKGRNNTELHESVEQYFGTLTRTVYYLTASITGGIDWTDVARPLWQMSSLYGFSFTMYVLLSVLGILNIVTGMFVERASNISKIDRDLAIADEIQAMESDIHESMKLFRDLDKAGDGKVPIATFMEFLTRERVIAHFATLDIDVTDRRRVGTILDVDGDGAISMEEFVIGCVRLRGAAKKSDLAALMIQMRKLYDLIDILEGSVKKLSNKVNAHGEGLDALHDLHRRTSTALGLVHSRTFEA